MPADIPNGQLIFVNGTRQFKSIIRYTCSPGHVLVGRSELTCDVDQRWNGPPPRCEPVYCDEPQQIRCTNIFRNVTNILIRRNILTLIL